MANSKNKKSSAASKKVADKATAAKADNVTKTATKSVTTAAKKAAPTKTASAAKSATNTAKTVEKTPTKTTGTASTKNVEAKKIDSKTAVKVDSKANVKKTPPTKPAQKEKRSGGGMAFLALLCSLGALGLSGYMFYEQKFSPKATQTQDALLSGVNDIKSNVTEFGGIVSGLQQDVKDFKESQSQYITKDTLDSVVKESVDTAVADLPDLPSIGPDALSPEEVSNSDAESATESSSSVSTEGSVPEGSTAAEGSSPAEGSSTSSVDSSTENAESEVAQQDEEDSAWSWGRAKQDLKDMVFGFISIKKTDQDKN